MANAICPRHSHCFPLEFSEVLGREGRALCNEIARLVRETAGVEEDEENAIALAAQEAEAARTESAAAAAASARADMSHFRDRVHRLEAALADAERTLAGLLDLHNPAYAALIGSLRARTRELEGRLAYYENRTAAAACRPWHKFRSPT